MKTVREWLNELDEPIKALAFERSFSHNLDKNAKSMGEALFEGVNFHDGGQAEQDMWFDLWEKHGGHDSIQPVEEGKVVFMTETPTLLDCFAMAASPAFAKDDHPDFVDRYAEDCYRFARAMMRVRDRFNKPSP